MIVFVFRISFEMTDQHEKESKNLEFTTLIWLDKHVYEQQNEQVSTNNNTPTRQQLRTIINYMKVFDQLETCQIYIQSVKKEEEIVLIASGTYCKEIMPTIHDLTQLRSVYIYCMNEQEYENWAKQFTKVKRTKNVNFDLDNRYDDEFEMTEHKLNRS